MNNILDNKVRHSIFGFVLGDCLGVPYEFKKSGTFKFKPFDGYGTFHQPQGFTWSDDTALTLAMLDAIADGEYDEKAHKINLKRFMNGDFFPDGYRFDVGNATRRAIISNFSFTMDDAYGNGGLLRIWTLAALSLQKEWSPEKEQQTLRQANGLTHSTQELYMTCCEFYLDLLKSLYRGDNYLERYQLWYAEISKRPDFKRYQTTQGHICNAIYNVMDTFFKYPEYDDIIEPMRHIIEKGLDTDSNAALLGALLGAKKEIPEKYLEKIRGIEKIDRYFGADDKQKMLNKIQRKILDNDLSEEKYAEDDYITLFGQPCEKFEFYPIDNPKKIDTDLYFSVNQYYRLTKGYFPPGDMSLRWVIYYENDWLYFIRSWTRFCIYKAKINKREKNYSITEFWVESNREKWFDNSDIEDIELFSCIILDLLEPCLQAV